MRIKKICFLAGEYPTPEKPKSAVFYQNLINEFAKMNIECRVIHPYAINYNIKKTKLKRVDNYKVEVYRPKTITLGAKKIGKWNTAYATACLYTYSVKNILNQMNWKPDIFYAHFISPAGVIAAKLSKEMGIPAFIAYGESEPWSINTIGINRCKRLLNSINGFISVSSKNKNDLINLNISDEYKVKVFPNAINNEIFYERDKTQARNKLGWSNDKFIVSFVGHFNDRKGVLRLEEAVKDIPNVYVAYAGSGDLEPKSKNMIFCGNVSPDLMPWFLSASDVFVLPTLNEGCCNAIIEAMACGLPIISSDREFNYDILSNDNSILINPENIEDIKSAIIKLRDDESLRKSLKENSLKTSYRLRLKERSRNILEWMEGRC